ncbi:RNA polymerase III subunit C82 [Malassezia vespertilionis]|uniref:RNA polymerase III subunit C82 n=1 Tax=Malassezia vespertilionis TaxID=2020962 RepID=UPI0024B16EA0|nr:RNA polymerase III subunit C82 [Malassezia vespertilionis]WFD06590.1 RNA polymerase III subunit C82 [Malassezia vespertilionis]
MRGDTCHVSAGQSGSSVPGRGNARGKEQLPLRLTQQSLIILIQHHCVSHSSPSNNETDEDFFEINIDEILARLRFGMYIDIARRWGGDEAAAVVRLLLYHGQIRVGAIMDALLGRPTNEPLNLPSDLILQPLQKPKQAEVHLRKLLVRMLGELLVNPSTPTQHISRLDRQLTHETTLRKSYKGIPTAKSLKEIKQRAAAMIDEEDQRDSKSGTNGSLCVGLKRKAQANSARDKRNRRAADNDVAANKAVPNGDATAGVAIDGVVWLRVNYDWFNVQMRNEVLVRTVAQKYNHVAGEVFRSMLQCDRAAPTRCETDERSLPISLTSLALAIPQDVRIQRGLDKRSIVGEESAQSEHTPTKAELLAEYVAILTSHDNISSSVCMNRFLAPHGSITTTSAGGSTNVPTSFTIEYINILRFLQYQMIRDVVVQRFGNIAGRIFTILVEKGKLEEKHISKLGLISMGETRDICGRLFAASLLSLQEVPKSNERNPQRTFFLWFVDLPKCSAWLLDHYYQTLLQVSRRRVYEQRLKSALIRKAERSDVKEDADGLLAEWERNSLAALRKVQEALTVVESRVILCAFVQRHFAAQATSTW